MRTELGFLCGVAALAALAGCPGELKNKEAFIAYAAEHEGAGAAPPSDAGAPGEMPTAGSASMAGSAATDPCGDVVQRIFVPTCGGTGCHSATGSQQGLDLVSDGVASRVVGVSGTTCLQTLADPRDPEGSLLYQKLLPMPGCGAQMPLARPPLSNTDVACVKSWIAAQAP
jgi:hypothetical protein